MVNKRLVSFFENFIIVAIILVIIQTFLDEWSRYAHWSITARDALIITGFIFDLIFTIEFVIRSVSAAKIKGAKKYWFNERGWVDFISSIPLLLADSGPSLFFLIMSGGPEAGSALGAIGVLKVVKAVRVTRILRLVRIIKIFGKIHNAESKMAQHHTATISTTAVFTIVCALMSFALFTDSTGKGKINERTAYYSQLIQKADKAGRRGLVKNLLKDDKKILKIVKNKRKIHESVKPDYFKKYYAVDDYIKLDIKKGAWLFYISIVDIHSDIALNHIESFIIIVLVVFAFMLIYTRHFVQNISDVAHILNKGLRKKNYQLEIKIKDQFKDHEINKIAQFYNDAYLPAKHRRQITEEENKTSGLSLDDLTSFKG